MSDCDRSDAGKRGGIAAMCLSLFLMTLLLAADAAGGDVNSFWDGGLTGEWTVDSNWTSTHWPDNNNTLGNNYSVFIDGASPNNTAVTLSAGNTAIDNLTVDAGDSLTVVLPSALTVLDEARIGGTLRVDGAYGVSTRDLTGLSAVSYGSLESSTGLGSVLVSDTVRWIDSSIRLIVDTGVVQDTINRGSLGSVGTHLAGSIVNNGSIDFDPLAASAFGDVVVSGTGFLQGPAAGLGQALWNPAGAGSTLRFQGTQTFEGGTSMGSAGLRIGGTAINEGVLRIADGAGVEFLDLQGGILENAVSGGSGHFLVTGTAEGLDNRASRLTVTGTIGDLTNSGRLDSNGALFDGVIANTGAIAIDPVGGSIYDVATIGGSGGGIEGPASVWNPVGPGSILTFQGTQTIESGMTINGTASVEGTLHVAPSTDVTFENLTGGAGATRGVLASDGGSSSRFVVTGTASDLEIATGGYLGSVGATFEGVIENRGTVNHDSGVASRYGNAVVEGVGGAITGVASSPVEWNPVDASSTLRFRGEQTIFDLMRMSGNVIAEGEIANKGTLENAGRFEVQPGAVVSGGGAYAQQLGETIVDGRLTQGSIAIAGGSLAGRGTVRSTGLFEIDPGASVRPGASLIGALILDADATELVFEGDLETQIGGLLAGSEYDVLDVTGIASLSGDVIVSLVDPADPVSGSNPFSPQAGDVFDILVATSIADLGLNLMLPAFSDLRVWEAAIVDTGASRQALRLTVVPEPTTLALLGIGLAGIAAAGRRRSLYSNDFAMIERGHKMKDSGSFSRPGNVVRVAGNLLALILLLSVPSIGHASLIDPPWVHAEASIGQPFVWSDTDEGSKSSASVDSASAVPGYRAFNSIAVSFASLEEAAVDFDRQLSRTASTHPLGCGSEARIFYEAVVDSTADYSWDLDYVFNSGYLNGIIEGGSVWVSVQRYDESQGWVPVYSSSVGPTAYNVPPGNYSGTGTFDLAQGNTYRISLGNSGALMLDTPLSSLQGTVSFDFNGVPEPTTAVLLGAGLMGIAAARRRRALH